MAANNYFGYTTGTPQFGTTSATSYPTSQTTNYAVQQHAAQQYAAAAPRTNQTTYDTYQNTGHATYQYAARQQPGYDKTQTQTYYTQAAQVAYSTPETPHYQTGVNKTTYTANATGYGTARPAATQKNQAAAAQQTAANSYVYSTNSAAGATGNYTSSYNTAASTSYPATMYVQQPAVVSQQSSGAVGGGASVMQQAMNTAANVQKSQGAGWGGFKKGFFKTQKPKPPPKPQQLHYCDVCKISCAGPQTYKEHLEGQKHKKKEASMKITQAQNSRGGTSLRCELCDVTCTGFDAYAAHIRGAKHQKVVKLHTKLGKPIPSTEPVVLSTNTTPPTTAVKGPAGGKANPKPGPAGGSMEGKKVLGTPKINFVGGTKLNTTASPDDSEDLKDDDGKLDGSLEDRNDVQPVGQDYIEEIRNDEGKVISFQCKLCECRFNDPNAKEMHMKGRRHRLQYKKKVNPDLIVDIKPSLRQRKIQEERLRRQQLREDLWKRREEERWREEMRYVGMMEEEERMYWEERRRYEEEMEYYEWYRRYGRDPRMLPPPRGFMGGPSGPNPMMPPRRPDSVDDRHIMAKHTQIYPKEEELSAVQKIVTNTEKALKLVSDFLAESDKPKDDKPKDEKMEEDKKPEVAADGTVKEGSEKEPQQPARILKGVMRVGVLAKGLLLTGDVSVQLVVMCAEKPTRTLLDRVADNLPKQFASVSPDEKYEVKRCVEEAALKVECAAEPTIVVVVTLTSPVMRESAEKDSDPAAPAPAAAAVVAAASGENVKDPPDVLDRQKCLDALAALRHAKWFQARASGLQSCVMIIRIMRDLCQRVPTWGRLSNWAVELLVEKVICSAGQYLSPGDAVRRVFEAVAGGLLLPGGPGLLDPCEKDALDAAIALTNQEREDITASSQHALRLIAFRQIHKVLGMDALPPPKFTRGQFNRKRRRDNSTGEGNDSEGAEGKKDKKEDSEAMETPEAAEKK